MVDAVSLPQTSNEEILNLTIRHAMLVERLRVGEVREIVKLLEEQVIPDLIERLTGRLERIVSRGFDSGVFSTRRYQETLKSLNLILDRGYKVLGETLVTDMLALAGNETEFALGSISRSIPLQFQFNSPGLRTIRSVVTRKIMGDVGVNMREALRGLRRAAKSQVKQAVDIGLVQGETTGQITRRVRNATGLMRRQAEAITRTAVRHTSTAVREATFAENTDVIKGVQFVATLDARTTDICASLDGRVFGVTEGPRPPMHHQCRSDITPVLKSWRELGINLQEAPEGTRAALDGQVPESLTYGQWLRMQPVAVQNEALGVGRAILFRRGVVPIERFTDSQFRPLNLDQLIALEKRLDG